MRMYGYQPLDTLVNIIIVVFTFNFKIITNLYIIDLIMGMEEITTWFNNITYFYFQTKFMNTLFLMVFNTLVFVPDQLWPPEALLSLHLVKQPIQRAGKLAIAVRLNT